MFRFTRPGVYAKASSPLSVPHAGNHAGFVSPNRKKPHLSPFSAPLPHDIRSPQRGPLNTPHPTPRDSDAPPTLPLHELFSLGLQNPRPASPSRPTPFTERGLAVPSPATPAGAHLRPIPRKRFGHKRLNSAALRADKLHRGIRRMHRRKKKNGSEPLSKLYREAARTMRSGLMTEEDKIFFKQLHALHSDSWWRNGLGACRDVAVRAEEEKPERMKTYVARDARATSLVAQDREAEAQARAIQEAMEKKRMEEEARRVAEWRRVREKIAQQEREARAAREKYLREERERQEREARAREEKVRADQLHQEAAAAENLVKVFNLYEGKWAELRANGALSGIDLRELPWPILELRHVVESEVASEHVAAFVLHALRPFAVEKSARDKVKAEIMRFHPDKFDAYVLPKVREHHRAAARDLAGAVARALTDILAQLEGRR